MAFFYMVFSCQDDLETSESIIPFRDETRERDGMGMDMINRNEIESHESEFRPIEHPIEPLDEDRPVKCPIPNSSLMNDVSMEEEQFSEILLKRAEEVSKNQVGLIAAAAKPPTPRALRKRHHMHTSNVPDHSVSPLLRMPSRNGSYHLRSASSVQHV